MSLVNTRVVQVDHNFINQKGMHHHLLVHLHQETELSIMVRQPPAYAKFGRNHSSICREGSVSCFKCAQTGHFMRECSKSKKSGGNGGNKAQPSSAAPLDRVVPRGTTSGTRGETNHLYALNNCQQQENSPNVVTCMIRVFDFIDYALLDPGENLFFVNPYVAVRFLLSNLANHSVFPHLLVNLF